MDNTIFDAGSLKFLETYLNTPSPTGFEAKGQKVWLDYLKPYIDDYIVDNYGTVVGIINPDSKYKVVIEAHADEISWFVHYIDKNGFIYVRRNGGSDHQIAPSKRVNIHTDNGIKRGVFGWPAIHTRKDGVKEAQPNLKTIFIDCGCSTAEEVDKLGIKIGHPITYDDCFEILNDKYFMCRAIDNRIGGFMIAQVAKLLKENKDQLPFGLYIVNAVQEEVGLNGAKMIAENIKPNAAIVTDVCHDTQTPLINKIEQGDFHSNKGPVLTIGPAVHNNLFNLIKTTAEEKEIAFQRLAASRTTGTDTDAFAFSSSGVPSALISLPIRYMHTTVEMAHKEDVKNTIRLIYESLKNIKKDQDFRYFS